jgi:phosphogluconate dehydratase
MIRLDAEAGTLEILVEAADWEARPQATADLSRNEIGMGRELFSGFRRQVCCAEDGAIALPELDGTVLETVPEPVTA